MKEVEGPQRTLLLSSVFTTLLLSPPFPLKKVFYFQSCPCLLLIRKTLYWTKQCDRSRGKIALKYCIISLGVSALQRRRHKLCPECNDQYQRSNGRKKRLWSLSQDINTSRTRAWGPGSGVWGPGSGVFISACDPCPVLFCGSDNMENREGLRL